jgi:hypothetical protein
MQLLNWGLKLHSRKLIACMVALIMFFSILGLGNPGMAWAKTDESDSAESLVVNILNPDGTTTLVHEYSYEELEPLEDIEYYATIDALPIGVGTKAEGVKIDRLIEHAAKKYNPNIKWESGKKLVFYVTDYPDHPYQGTNYYTYDLLYGQDRYYFPRLVETYDPEVPGSVSIEEAMLVEPMLASSSYQERRATHEVLQGEVKMDSKESFRFCMGITEEEATTEGFSTTNKFARWVYRMDVGPISGARLTADTTDNEIGQLIEITVTGEPTGWYEAITQVKVDEDVLDREQYEITAGKITINSGVFIEPGTYTITVEASGFMDSTVIQEITGAGVPAPPVLKAEASDNIIGDPVEITFTDDVTWREAITEIKVGDIVLADDQYSISEGKITIAADVFPVADTYIIVIKATDFQNATLKQYIVHPPGEYELTLVEDVIYTIGETSDGIKTMTVNPDYSGMKYFGVQVTPVIAHEGLETVVFTQWRDDTQLAIAAIRADFNIVQAPLPEAQVGFNVQSGDIIKVCVFDQLSNDADRNPVPFQ